MDFVEETSIKKYKTTAGFVVFVEWLRTWLFFFRHKILSLK